MSQTAKSITQYTFSAPWLATLIRYVLMTLLALFLFGIILLDHRQRSNPIL